MNEGVNTKEAKGFVIHWQATRRSRRSFPLLFSSILFLHPSLRLTSSGYIERCFLKPNPVSSVVDASMLIRYNVQASIETAASSVHYGVPRTMASRATMIYVARPVPGVGEHSTGPLDQDRTLIATTNQRRIAAPAGCRRSLSWEGGGSSRG